MTIYGRDASNFDGAVSFDGLGYFTHKSTEGTSIVHDRYGPRLDAARAAGVPVLGAYHVVRTPGNGGHGSLAAQLAFWFGYLDAHTPWWRTHPHFMLQIDAETWPYDSVSAATVKAFAQLVVNSGVRAYAVTYASRGQYGSSLSGIATDLWNADYRGSVNGSYPGDDWTVAGKGSAAGWAPYSGQVPRFLQYASRPYDEDAFRGTLAELLTLTGGVTPQPQEDDMPKYYRILGGEVGVSNGPVRWGFANPADVDVSLAAHGLTWSDIQTITPADLAGTGWGVNLNTLVATVAAIASKVDIGPAELEQIKQAAGAGVAAAAPAIVDALLAKLPAGTLSRNDVEAAVQHALAGAKFTTTTTVTAAGA